MAEIAARQTNDRIELVNGAYRAVFLRDGRGWTPDWVYLDDEPVLRFKDHEWLSVGHLRSTAQAATIEDGAGEKAVLFTGETNYMGTPVAWTVRVSVTADEPYFHIRTTLRPAETIELLEAFTSIETPYTFPSTAHTTCIIAQNPTTCWHDGKSIAKPRWEDPRWRYIREDAAFSIITPQTPLLSFRVIEREGATPLYVNIIGDWHACTFHNIFMTPTIFGSQKSEFLTDFRGEAQQRGYKFIVGGLNWSSSRLEDPNVLFEGGQTYTQDFYMTAAREAATFDDWAYQGFLKAVALHFPADGIVPAYERAKEKHTRVEDGNRWLMDVVNSDGCPGFYDPAHGMTIYIEGTRPKVAGYSKYWLDQWMGPVGYQAWATDRPEDARYCARHVADTVASIHRNPMRLMGVVGLPALYYALLTRDEAIIQAFREETPRILAALVSGTHVRIDDDNGNLAQRAEGMILLGRLLGEPALRDAGLGLLALVNADLDHRFWFFGCSHGKDAASGKHSRPFGHGHAALANTLAFEETGDDAYLDNAERCARYMLALGYTAYNASADPDFDIRGWANGATGGRDLTADYPPWEASEGVRTASYLLRYRPMIGLYRMLWYQRRTLQAGFPAAREFKLYYTTDERRLYRPVREVASEGNIYLRYPFLMYENPLDQTLQASYQGVEPLQNTMAYCGGLAEVADDRLLALVPAAIAYDPTIKDERLITVYNPLAHAIDTTLTVKHMRPKEGYTVTVDGVPRSTTTLTDLPITVPGERVVEVMVR